MPTKNEINTLNEFGETIPSKLNKIHATHLLEILQYTKKNVRRFN